MATTIIQAILIFSSSLAISLICAPLLLKLAHKFALYDAPLSAKSSKVAGGDPESWRKVHRAPIPRLGGVAIFLGATLSYLLFANKSGLACLLLPGLFIFALGLADDFISIPARWRLLLQTLAAFIAVYFSGLMPTALNFFPGITLMLPSWLGGTLAVFVIVGSINATNMIDGLDGLATGLTLIALLLLGFICYFHYKSSDQILIIILPLLGGLLGFLKYNTHPAKMFMGDGGSNFLGYFIGIMLLLLMCNKTLSPQSLEISSSKIAIAPATVANAPLLQFFSILLILALPIYDSACVIVFRLKNKQSPFKADQSHFHHSLLRVGLSHAQSVTTLYFIAFIVGIAGLVPIVFPAPNYQFAWVPYAVTAVLLFAIIGGRKANKNLIHRIKTSRLLLSNSTQLSKPMASLLGYWESLNKYLLYAFLAVLPLFAGVQKEAIGYGAVVAAVLVFISFFFKGASNDFIDSLLLSIGIFLLLVVNNQNPMTVMLQGRIYNVHYLYNYLFVFLFFSSFVFVIFTMRKKYLEISPTDFLLAALPLILLLTPEPYRAIYRLNIIGLRSLVIFMVLRVFARRNKQVVHHARFLTLVGLIYVILTSLLGFRIIYI